MKANLKLIAILLIFFIIGFAVVTLLKPNGMNKYNLPENVYTNPTLREAYTFAIENPEILEKYPCYCGCININHRNNKDCYFDEDGNLRDHAASCGGCVGITLDIKKMTEQGEDFETIYDYIEEKYAPNH